MAQTWTEARDDLERILRPNLGWLVDEALQRAAEVREGGPTMREAGIGLSDVPNLDDYEPDQLEVELLLAAVRTVLVPVPGQLERLISASARVASRMPVFHDPDTQEEWQPPEPEGLDAAGRVAALLDEHRVPRWR